MSSSSSSQLCSGRERFRPSGPSPPRPSHTLTNSSRFLGSGNFPKLRTAGSTSSLRPPAAPHRGRLPGKNMNSGTGEREEGRSGPTGESGPARCVAGNFGQTRRGEQKTRRWERGGGGGQSSHWNLLGSIFSDRPLTRPRRPPRREPRPRERARPGGSGRSSTAHPPPRGRSRSPPPGLPHHGRPAGRTAGASRPQGHRPRVPARGGGQPPNAPTLRL